MITLIVIFSVGLVLGIGITFLFLQKKMKILTHKAKIDELTGLLKYSELKPYINKKIKSDTSFLLSLILIDLDNFKHINDNFGYSTGDEILKEFASFLTENLRDNDIIFRYKQGDEFAILLNENIEISTKIILRLQTKLKNNSNLQLSEIEFSFGISKIDKLDYNKSIHLSEQMLRLRKKNKK